MENNSKEITSLRKKILGKVRDDKISFPELTSLLCMLLTDVYSALKCVSSYEDEIDEFMKKISQTVKISSILQEDMYKDIEEAVEKKKGKEK